MSDFGPNSTFCIKAGIGEGGLEGTFNLGGTKVKIDKSNLVSKNPDIYDLGTNGHYNLPFYFRHPSGTNIVELIGKGNKPVRSWVISEAH